MTDAISQSPCTGKTHQASDKQFRIVTFQWTLTQKTIQMQCFCRTLQQWAELFLSTGDVLTVKHAVSPWYSRNGWLGVKHQVSITRALRGHRWHMHHHWLMHTAICQCLGLMPEGVKCQCVGDKKTNFWPHATHLGNHSYMYTPPTPAHSAKLDSTNHKE